LRPAPACSGCRAITCHDLAQTPGLVTTNDKGEREILGEAARAAEARRLREIMASDCAAP